MITIVAKCFLKPDKKAEFISGVKNLIEDSRNEEGNIAYDLYEDRENNNIVAFIEKWKDEEAINQHNKSKHFQAGITSIKEFSDNIEINSFTQI